MSNKDINPDVFCVTELTQEHWDWWQNLDKNWQEILLDHFVSSFRSDDILQEDNESFNQLHEREKLLHVINLKSLFLYHNENFKDGKFAICDLSPLSCLNKVVMHTCIGVDYKNLKTISNLTYLAIEKSNIVALGDEISELKNLKVLSLYNNEIKDIEPLIHLKELTYLNLSLNEIEDVEPLGQLTQLTDLYLRDNPIDESKIIQLQEKLPNCRIHSTSVLQLLEYVGNDTDKLDDFELAIFNTLKTNKP